jgi:hypothetical protein
MTDSKVERNKHIEIEGARLHEDDHRPGDMSEESKIFVACISILSIMVAVKTSPVTDNVELCKSFDRWCDDLKIK